MCIIAICDGRALTRAEFKNCWDNNDHGAGFSWYNAAGINYKKGFMDEKKAWRAYTQIKNNLPHVAHFRLTSAGSKTPELTHPFTCADLSPIELAHTGTDSVLFHNGTIRAWKDWHKAFICSRRAIPQGEMSDTRLAACLVHRIGAEILEELEDKFALVTPAGIMIYGEKWTKSKDEQITFSNDGFEEKARPTWSYAQRYQNSQFDLCGGDTAGGWGYNREYLQPLLGVNKKLKGAI